MNIPNDVADLILAISRAREWERMVRIADGLAVLISCPNSNRHIQEWLLGGIPNPGILSTIPSDELQAATEFVEQDFIKPRFLRLLRVVVFRTCKSCWSEILEDVANDQPTIKTKIHRLVAELNLIGDKRFTEEEKPIFLGAFDTWSCDETILLCEIAMQISIIDRIPKRYRVADVAGAIISQPLLTVYFDKRPDLEDWLASPNETHRAGRFLEPHIFDLLNEGLDAMHRKRKAAALVGSFCNPNYSREFKQVSIELKETWAARLFEACRSTPVAESKLFDVTSDFADELEQHLVGEPTSELADFLADRLRFSDICELWFEVDRIRRKDQRKFVGSLSS